MKYFLSLLAISLSLTVAHLWATPEPEEGKPLKLRWEKGRIIDHQSQEDSLPQIIKVNFSYKYGYYYKPPGSPFYVYQPYMRAIRTHTGVQYVPTAIIQQSP